MEIRLSGAGGQGLLLGAQLLAEALVLEGWQVAQSQAYEPVSRGGVSRSDLVANRAEVDYPLVTALDLLVILNQPAVEVSRGLIKQGALVLVDDTRVPDPPRGKHVLYSLPFSDTAQRLGNVRMTNMVALGALAGLSAICPASALRAAIEASSPAKFLSANLDALQEGFALVENLAGQSAVSGA